MQIHCNQMVSNDGSQLKGRGRFFFFFFFFFAYRMNGLGVPVEDKHAGEMVELFRLGVNEFSSRRDTHVDFW
jgi:hypothetical protein